MKDLNELSNEELIAKIHHHAGSIEVRSLFDKWAVEIASRLEAALEREREDVAVLKIISEDTGSGLDGVRAGRRLKAREKS